MNTYPRYTKRSQKLLNEPSVNCFFNRDRFFLFLSFLPTLENNHGKTTNQSKMRPHVRSLCSLLQQLLPDTSPTMPNFKERLASVKKRTLSDIYFLFQIRNREWRFFRSQLGWLFIGKIYSKLKEKQKY